MKYIIMSENSDIANEFAAKLAVSGSDCSSPIKSPSTAFTQTPLENAEKCIVQSVLLSYWDNILGPKIHHLWYNPTEELLSRKMLSYISSHTLNGEICRELTESSVDNKIYFIAEESLIVTAFIFSAMSKMGMSVFSLSVITPMCYKKTYLSWHELCVLWMTRSIGKFRILLDKNEDSEAISEFSSYICNFVSMLNSLRCSSMQSRLDLNNTAFHPDHQSALPFHHDRQVALQFIHRAIASHLITCRRSVVVGSSLKKVNMLISTLALFLMPEERLCSVLASEESIYHPDLCVQGFLKSLTNSQNMSLKEILYSRFPTTLIDVSTLDVRQSPSLHQHTKKQHDIMKRELTHLWQGQKTSDVYPMSEMFTQYDDKESLVKNFFEEVFQLYSASGVRETYIEQFMRLIDKKALALIKYVQSETHGGKGNFKAGLKKMKSDLSLSMMGDFKIVLSGAELLKPGLYDCIFGDHKLSDTELQHYLETF